MVANNKGFGKLYINVKIRKLKSYYLIIQWVLELIKSLSSFT
jgi:hypothetical protein